MIYERDKMNKKGEMTMTQIIGALIALLVFIVAIPAIANVGKHKEATESFTDIAVGDWDEDGVKNAVDKCCCKLTPDQEVNPGNGCPIGVDRSNVNAQPCTFYTKDTVKDIGPCTLKGQTSTTGATATAPGTIGTSGTASTIPDKCAGMDCESIKDDYVCQDNECCRLPDEFDKIDFKDMSYPDGPPTCIAK